VRLKPLTNFIDSVLRKEISIVKGNSYAYATLKPINALSSVRVKALRLFSKKVDRI